MIQIDARNITITLDLGRDITYEVLIENLGGYESAKSKFRDNGSLHAERLKKALLQYRRQHNIFEVGDLSLTIDPWFGSNLLVVVDFRESETERYAIFSDGGFFRISGLRHATDEEIKAGKRLEVKSEN